MQRFNQEVYFSSLSALRGNQEVYSPSIEFGRGKDKKKRKRRSRFGQAVKSIKRGARRALDVAQDTADNAVSAVKDTVSGARELRNVERHYGNARKRAMLASSAIDMLRSR